jgi:hypothetical protein
VTRPVLYEQLSESELMAQARAALRRHQACLGGPAPVHETIVNSEYREYLAAKEKRCARSLQACHRFSLYERPRHAPPRDTGAYVPQASAGIENDRNLTDGARRCARKILELTYRANRSGRTLDVTVTYLARTLGKCRRSVQRYLRLLEREGYIQVEVVASGRSRMCFGLVIELLAPLFPRHHRQKWPEDPGNPGATEKSQINRFNISKGRKDRIPVLQWAMRCMDGVFRAKLRTLPPIAAV